MALLMLFALVAGAGSTGSTHGLSAVPAPATSAKSMSSAIGSGVSSPPRNVASVGEVVAAADRAAAAQEALAATALGMN